MRKKHEELLCKMASQLDSVWTETVKHGSAMAALFSRLDSLEDIVQSQRKQIDQTKKTANRARVKTELHDQQIDQLKAEVNRLKETAAIWWGDGRVALDKDESYKGFRSIHLEPRKALRELEGLGILILDCDGKRTVPVRSGRKVRRAVMVKEDT